MKTLYLLALSCILPSQLFAQIPVMDVCTDCNNQGCSEWFEFDGAASDNSDYYIQIDSDSTNVWQVGLSSKIILSSNFYDNVLITDTLNPYPINNTSVFEFAIRNCDHNTAYYGGGYYWTDIYMNLAYDTEPGSDGLMIEVKHGINGAWTNLIEDMTPGLTMSNTYTVNDTVAALGAPGYSGVSSNTQLQIQYPAIDLGMMYDTVYFKFTFASDSVQTNQDGFMFATMNFGGFFWSIEENMVKEPLKFYPNPAINRVTIDAQGFSDGEVIIYDVTGREVLNQRFGNGEIDVSRLEPGRYVVRCSTSDKIQKGNLLVH